MSPFINRLSSEIKTDGPYIALFSMGSYVAGHLYGRFADLPPRSCAIAWCIYAFASQSMRLIAQAYFKQESAVLASKYITGIGLTSLFIYKMRKWELMGDKLMYLMIGINLYGAVQLIISAARIYRQER